MFSFLKLLLDAHMANEISSHNFIVYSMINRNIQMSKNTAVAIFP